MGKLFSEMTSLVMEQSEVVGRIEDDVEAGLEDMFGMNFDEFLSELIRDNSKE